MCSAARQRRHSSPILELQLLVGAGRPRAERRLTISGLVSGAVSCGRPASAMSLLQENSGLIVPPM